MVTFMIVWMRRHARGLKRRARGRAPASALAEGSAIALVGDGVLRRDPRGLRDRRVPARRLPDASTDPVAAGVGARARRRRRGR